MTDYERFEIRAECFRLMTGHMHPGKDPASITYPASYETRSAAHEDWLKKNDECVHAMLRAFESVMEETE